MRTIFSTGAAIAELVKRADLLIGAVLVPGAKAPKIITPRDARRHETGERYRGCGDRPGRLLRELAADEHIPTRLMSWTALCIIA